MHIAFLAPEVWPFTPLGALGEMSHDMALALADLGHEVSIITIKPSGQVPEGLRELPHKLEIPISWKHHQATVYEHSPAPNVTNYFIYNPQLFEREGLYGNSYGEYEDNGERFIFYNRAAIELMLAVNMRPDIIHVNNWTTSMVPLYLKSLYAGHEGLGQAKSVMTVHNLANQGIFWHYDMPLTGLGWEYFNSESLEFYGKINLLKAGLVYADQLVFTSPSFYHEAFAHDTGHGLHGVMGTRKANSSWIRNGVARLRWSPEFDGHLAARYSSQDTSGKEACKAFLRQRLELPDSGRPLLAISGRLGARRGFEGLAAWLGDILAQGVDVAVLGKAEHGSQAMFHDLKAAHGPRLGVSFDFSPEMAHVLLAGSDMALLHSYTTSEQTHYLKAQIYGTVPVALNSGPVKDCILNHTPEKPGTGFIFPALEKEEVLSTLKQAVECWHHKQGWQAIMKRGMLEDHDWIKTAEAYVEVYRQITSGQ